MVWNSAARMRVAAKIANTIQEELTLVYDRERLSNLAYLSSAVLTAPRAFLEDNEEKFSEFVERGPERGDD